ACHSYFVYHSLHSSLLLFFLPIHPPPTPTLFPYTTLFRSPVLTPSCQERRTAPPASGSGRGPRSDARVREAASDRDLTRLQEERSEEHTSELQSPDLVCRLLLEKKKKKKTTDILQHMTTSA